MGKILLLLVFLGWAGLPAQGQTAELKGTIQDGDLPMAGANVQLQQAENTRATTTTASGSFEFHNIPPGLYTLRISYLGYRTLEEELVLGEGEVVNRTFELRTDRLNIDGVVISATRYALDRSRAPVMVNILDKKVFEAASSMSLAEGLIYQPGVRIETNCQNCGFTQVRLNGLEGAYSQILINSRPVYSALNGVYGLDQIPANIIERVEVVRSGGSALYGSNAIAGTINIITKEPRFNTWSVNSNFALIDGEAPDHTINFNASLVSDDLNSGVTFYGMRRQRDAYDANADGFSEITRLENNTFGAKAFLKPGDRSEITLDFSAIQEYRRGGDRLELAPHFTDITEELDHNTLLGGITYTLDGRDGSSQFSAYLSGQTTQRDSYYGGLGGGTTPADSTLALNAYGATDDLALVGGVQYARTFDSKDILTVGVENQYNDVQDIIPGYNRLVDQQVHMVGVYGQYEWKPINQVTALLGVRYDYATVNGLYEIGNIERSAGVDVGVLSPRLTLLYDINKFLQFRGGYARGFRAPQAFNEDLHVASVGGEPQFVIPSDELETEFSNAFTASFNYTRTFGNVQTNFLVEGFYTQLENPFTIVSTGATLPNGSILEEVRNGAGANVGGVNFDFGVTPSAALFFQLGGTLQTTGYDEAQVLFEPENGSEATRVVVDEFIRNPNVYGYFTALVALTDRLDIDLTGAYTGAMIVPRVADSAGSLDLVDTDPFFEVNLKLAYQFSLLDRFSLELNGGVQNILNSFQDDFDTGPARDSDYVYGPARPRTFFLGLKFGDFFK